eukprot:3916295-Amphidinium_carterae.2
MARQERSEHGSTSPNAVHTNPVGANDMERVAGLLSKWPSPHSATTPRNPTVFSNDRFEAQTCPMAVLLLRSKMS